METTGPESGQSGGILRVGFGGHRPEAGDLPGQEAQPFGEGPTPPPSTRVFLGQKRKAHFAGLCPLVERKSVDDGHGFPRLPIEEGDSMASRTDLEVPPGGLGGRIRKGPVRIIEGQGKGRVTPGTEGEKLFQGGNPETAQLTSRIFIW